MRDIVHRAIVAQGHTHLLPAMIAQSIEHVEIAPDKRRLALDQIFLGERGITKHIIRRLYEPQCRTGAQQASGSTLCQSQGLGHLPESLVASRQMSKKSQLQCDVERARRHKAQSKGM